MEERKRREEKQNTSCGRERKRRAGKKYIYAKVRRECEEIKESERGKERKLEKNII